MTLRGLKNIYWCVSISSHLTYIWVLDKYNPYVEWLLNSYIIWLIDKIPSHKEWWETAFLCKERFP